MPSARPQKETPAHRQAFEDYYWMRPRSMRALGKRLNKSVSSLEAWAQTFDWAKRINDREVELHKRIAEENDDAYIKARTRQIEIAIDVQEQFHARLGKLTAKQKKDGITKYEPNATDAQRWASQENLLLGAATSRTEIGFPKGMLAGIISAITAVIRRDVPAVCPHCKTHLGLPAKLAAAMREACKRLMNNPESEDGVEPEKIVAGD